MAPCLDRSPGTIGGSWTRTNPETGSQFAVFCWRTSWGISITPHAAITHDAGAIRSKVSLPDGRKMNPATPVGYAAGRAPVRGQNESTVARSPVQKYAAAGDGVGSREDRPAKIQAWISESNQLARPWRREAARLYLWADMEQTRSRSRGLSAPNGAVVRKQLARRAIRLAAALNRAFGD